ncbi:MAG TPA: MBL fold metallo-hydrolase [Steroidobacteraceae bacterium]|nr:MBL fold metallo-hydrolase [Steroidobacteraceae bacterium]
MTRTTRVVGAVTRRTLLQGAVTAGLGAALKWRPALADIPTPITHMALGKTLHLFQGAGGNVIVAGGADGVLLVDGGLAARSAELLQQVGTVMDKGPVQVLFNTHWHWQHTGSNEALGKAGAKIIAHQNTALWLGTHVDSRWEQRIYPPLPAAARPTQTFYYGDQKLSFGGQDLQYAVMPQAHTDGDIYVFFPRENVLVAGDVVSGGQYPLLDWCTNGWLGGMVEGLATLIAKVDGDTRIIPGDGPVRSKADLMAQRDMCQEVLGRIGTSYFKGDTWEQLVASRPTREFDARWGNPDQFLKLAYEGAWYHVNEIRRYTFRPGTGGFAPGGPRPAGARAGRPAVPEAGQAAGSRAGQPGGAGAGR